MIISIVDKKTIKYYNMKVCIVVFCFALSNAFLLASPIKAFVSILPQKCFVEAIAGDAIAVETLVRPGQSPETFEPSPSHIALLSKSKFLFVIGLPFEKILVKKIKAFCPNIIIVHTQNGITKRKMGAVKHNDHIHHKGDDPHIWLDPLLVKIQAENMAKAIIQEFPNLKSVVSNNLKSLNMKLDKTFETISMLLHSKKGKTLLAFHPAFGYFTDRFGLKQKAIEFEGKSPSPRQMAKIIRNCKKENIRSIFSEKQFASDAAHTIAKVIDGKVIIVDPLAQDYFENLHKIAKLILENM